MNLIEVSQVSPCRRPCCVIFLQSHQKHKLGFDNLIINMKLWKHSRLVSGQGPTNQGNQGIHQDHIKDFAMQSTGRRCKERLQSMVKGMKTLRFGAASRPAAAHKTLPSDDLLTS